MSKIFARMLSPLGVVIVVLLLSAVAYRLVRHGSGH